MVNVVLLSSFLVKTVTLITLLSAFAALAVPEEMRKGADFLTKYYLMRKNYRLLRMSLLFIAAIIVLEMASMMIMVAMKSNAISDAILLSSDVVFMGLALLLSRIYRLKRISDAELKYLSEKK